MKNSISININQLSTGFVEIPGQISLNIYVQGCKKRCSKCHNLELQNFEGGTKIYLKDINQIINDYPICNWICWLGGDAVYQPEGLISFSKEFRKFGLKICLYTGLKFEELDNKIIENLDVIIDGEWTGKKVMDENTNQRIWINVSKVEWYQITWKQFEEMYKN